MSDLLVTHMCNEAARRAALDLIRDDQQVRIPLVSERLPDLQSLDSLRITDPAATG